MAPVKTEMLQRRAAQAASMSSSDIPQPSPLQGRGRRSGSPPTPEPAWSQAAGVLDPKQRLEKSSEGRPGGPGILAAAAAGQRFVCSGVVLRGLGCAWA